MSSLEFLIFWKLLSFHYSPYGFYSYSVDQISGSS